MAIQIEEIDAKIRLQVTGEREVEGTIKKVARDTGVVLDPVFNRRLELNLVEFQKKLEQARGQLKLAKLEGDKNAEFIARLKVNQLRSDTTEAGRLLRNYTNIGKTEVSRLGNLFNGIGTNIVDSLSGLIGPIAIVGGLTTAVTGIVNEFGLATQSAKTFEKQMQNVATLVDTTTENMDDMKLELLAIAERVPVSVGELATALYDVRSAGVQAKDAMAILEQGASLAVAGLGTTKEAVNLLTTAYNAFNKQGLSATEIAETFFIAVKNGKTTVSELSQGFGKVASLASNLNIDFKELVAGATALTTTGLSASEAYTQLQGVIQGVAKTRPAAVKLAKDLGIEFDATALSSKGLQKFLQDIRDRLTEVGITGPKAVEVLSQLFGSTEALSGVLALTGANAEAFNNTLQDIRAGGALGEGFNKQLETTEARLQRLNNELEVQRIKLGENFISFEGFGIYLKTEFLTTLNGVISGISNVSGFFGELTDKILNFVGIEPVFEKQEQSIGKFSERLKEITKETEGQVKQNDNLVASLEKLNEQFSNGEIKVDEYLKKKQALQDQQGALITSNQELNREYGVLENAQELLSKSTQEYQEGLAQANKEVLATGNVSIETANRLVTLETKLEDVKKVVNGVEISFDDLNKVRPDTSTARKEFSLLRDSAIQALNAMLAVTQSKFLLAPSMSIEAVNLSKKLTTLGVTLNNVKKNAGDFTKEIENTGSGTADIGGGGKAKKNGETLIQTYEKLRKELDGLVVGTEEFNQKSSELNNLSKKIGDTTGMTFGELKKQLEEAGKEMTKVKDEAEKAFTKGIDQQIDKTNGKVKSLADEIKGIKQGLADLGTNKDTELSSRVITIDSDILEAKKSLELLNSELNSFGQGGTIEQFNNIQKSIAEEQNKIKVGEEEKALAFKSLSDQEKKSLQEKIDKQKEYNSLSKVEQILVDFDTQTKALEQELQAKETALQKELSIIQSFQSIKDKILEDSSLKEINLANKLIAKREEVARARELGIGLSSNNTTSGQSTGGNTVNNISPTVNVQATINNNTDLEQVSQRITQEILNGVKNIL